MGTGSTQEAGRCDLSKPTFEEVLSSVKDMDSLLGPIPAGCASQREGPGAGVGHMRRELPPGRQAPTLWGQHPHRALTLENQCFFSENYMDIFFLILF